MDKIIPYNKRISKFESFIKEQIINDFPAELLNDGLIKSVDTEECAKRITTALRNCDIAHQINYNDDLVFIELASDFEPFKPKEFIDVINKINSVLNVCGYIISSSSINGGYTKVGGFKQEDLYRKDIHGCQLDLIKRFNNPEKQDNVPEFLYHVTESKFADKIRLHGLIPKAKNKIQEHPERIYLMDNIIGSINFIEQLVDKYPKTDVTDYKIIKVDSKIVKKLKLYNDGSYSGFDEFNAYYTYDNIGPAAIVDIIDVTNEFISQYQNY